LNYDKIEINNRDISTLEKRYYKYLFSSKKIKDTSERITGFISFFITYLIIIPSGYSSFENESKMQFFINIAVYWPAWLLWFVLYTIVQPRIDRYLRKGKNFNNEAILKEKIEKLKVENRLLKKTSYTRSGRSSNKTNHTTPKSKDISSENIDSSQPQGKEELNFELIENLNDIFKTNVEEEIVSSLTEISENMEDIIYTKKPKEDYIESAIIKKEIGLEGELFILNYERNKLQRKGQLELSEKVKHISVEYGDGYGYDILSFDENGNEKYIEVKTTIQDLNTVFYVSDSEYKKASTLKNYFIYRVFNFDLETKKGKLYIINTSKDLKTYFITEPVSFRFTPIRF
jgi:hypothetical protein